LSMNLIWQGSALAVLSQRQQETGLPFGDVVEDLIYGYLNSGAIEPRPGAGVPAQHRVGVADRPP